MTGLPHPASQPQRPFNRAERRRQRRTKVFTGASLALTTSLVGVFPGGSRYARSYAAASTDTANCGVSDWAELKAALAKYELRVPASDILLEFACSTITFLNDIDDTGVADATAGRLPTVNVLDDTLTIDGQGNTLTFSSTLGGGLVLYPYNASTDPGSFTAVTITDLELNGTPNEAAPAIFVSTLGANVDITVENSWIHDNTSTNAPALQINNASPYLDVDIINSEFSYNGRGAVWVGGTGEAALAVTDSFFHDNYSGGSYAGAISVEGSVSIVDSTFSDNESLLGAGGISVVHTSSADPISVSNSTFWDNNGLRVGSLEVYVPPAGAGGTSAGDIQPTVGGQGVVTIDHSTFAAGDGLLVGVREIFVYSYDVDSTFTLTNSIVWGGYTGSYDVALATDNAASFTATVSHTAIESMFSGSGLYDLAAAGTNIYGVSYRQYELNPLGDNGGTVLPSFQFGDGLSEAGHIPTMLPTSGSVVIDAAGTGGPAFDQRGVERPLGDAADMGAVEVEPSSDVTVTVTPPASQTITYGQSADLTPTYDGFADGDTWETEPTCAVYDDADNEVSAPYPVGTYTIKCAGGTLPAGYTADYSATGTLVVEKAAATLTYTGTSGSTANSSVNLSATISDGCSTEGITYTVNGIEVEGGSYAVTAGNLYEIEVSYSDPNCEAAAVYAVVLATSTTDASSGGGYYNVSGAGKINFGYTVQINKSKNGSTQVSGQILWNSQNGKFRFKGVITGFVKTTTDCAPGTVCGRIIGTGTLRVRNELGEWVVVASGMAFKASVTDAGTASVCTGGRKSTCSTVNKPDFFGIDILGSNLTGEQPAPAGGWPTAVQLSGGNILIK